MNTDENFMKMNILRLKTFGAPLQHVLRCYMLLAVLSSVSFTHKVNAGKML